MPNWCHNDVLITHDDPTQLERIKRAFVENRLCEEFLPVSHLPQNKQYDAALRLWGTKTNVGGGDEESGDVTLDENSLSLNFETAWSPPIGLFDALVEAGFTVDASYFEPGCAFVGVYVDGSHVCYDYTAETLNDCVPLELIERYAINLMLE